MIKKSKNKKKCNCFDQGGFLGGYSMPFSGALGYSLAMDDMLRKGRKAQNTDTMKTTSVDAGVSPALFAYGGLIKDNPTLFAIGGDMQTNGSDFGSGMMHIDAGGSHEENPYDGVQLGTDAESVPNLVEEGEVVFNDYVYSRRIELDQEALRRFHFPKKAKLTYADAAKRLEKEIAERPNDPISKASFKAQMEQLADEQERQKQEMEAERAKEAFEALSPEEQTALMQQKAQQDAMAEQAAQEQVMAKQQAIEQPTPEEMAMAQGQMSPEEIAMAQQQADGSQAMIAQPQAMAAYGGKIHRFDDGGTLKKKLYSLLGRATDSDFKKWLEEMGEGKLDYESILKAVNEGDLNALQNNADFIKALSKENRGLAHSVSLGNNLGTFTPSNEKATIQSISKGNWKATNGVGWNGSEDMAFQQATKDMTKEQIDALTTEQLAELMRNTDAYKNTSKWLENSDNALLYLNTLLNDPDTPEVAKEYARKYVKDGKWKDGFNYDYATVFGANGKGVRETDPGTYWHSVREANRGNEQQNYLINDDGTVELITGTTEGLTPAGTHAWQDEKNDMTVNYYTRPATRAAVEPVAKGDEELAEVAPGLKPKYKKETNIGMWGPAVGLGLQLAGVGKPDTSGIDAAVASASQPAYQADWMPRGDFAVYRPDDPWFYTSPIMAQANAGYRSFDNSILPSKDASKLALGYNTMIALGNAQRQQLDSNFDKYMKTKQYNGTIYDANQKEYGTTSRFNADALNRANQHSAQIALQGAAQKMDADAGWHNSLYGNIGGLFNNIKQWEKYKRDHNTLADMWANGLAGVVTEKTPVASKYVEAVGDAEGGEVRRKKSKRRGLTI